MPSVTCPNLSQSQSAAELLLQLGLGKSLPKSSRTKPREQSPSALPALITSLARSFPVLRPSTLMATCSLTQKESPSPQAASGSHRIAWMPARLRCFLKRCTAKWRKSRSWSSSSRGSQVLRALMLGYSRLVLWSRCLDSRAAAYCLRRWPISFRLFSCLLRLKTRMI